LPVSDLPDGDAREKRRDPLGRGRRHEPKERLCIILILLDLLFLLEYVSVLYERDDNEGGDEE
jgi:hypothetical protein